MRSIHKETSPQVQNKQSRIDRLLVLRIMFSLIGLIFVARLFYIQVIKADYYKGLARSEQFKELQIEPERGSIYMRNGSSDPLALAINETRFTIIADPTYISNKQVVADTLAPILGLQAGDIKTTLDKPSRYAVIAKKVSKDVKDKIIGLELKGIAYREERIRTYPQGAIGSTVLGFVNDDGEGQYGLEGSLNAELKGEPGIIKAITDRQGIPLVQNKDNIVQAAKDGENVLLSIDSTVQRLAEEEIKKGVEATKAKSGSIVITEVDTGRIVGMSSFPSYNPAEYSKVEDANLFKNKAVSDPLEPGSIMKILTVSTALDRDVVSKDSTYFDSGTQTIDDTTIRNVTELGSGTRSIFNILEFSLNTGAIYLLKQLGAGEITAEARKTTYDYFKNHFHFVNAPLPEQEEATEGYVPDPVEGDGLRVQYANMSFGQGMSVTIQQFSTALGSVLNGGTYYNPTLIYAKEVNGEMVEQKPITASMKAVDKATSDDMIDLMSQYARSNLRSLNREGFIIGGKTGTAQVPMNNGGYRTDAYNATFAGFVGREKPKYAIVIRLDEGSATSGFSGFNSARPVFEGVVNGIMDNVPIENN